METLELAYRIRRDAIEMVHISHSSHIGSALSVADILAVLYGKVLNVFPDHPQKASRDRLVMSKGHAAVALYAALAEIGFFPVDELKDFCQNGSFLSGHISGQVPGVELSTGSLGHGVCVACGMALAAKLDHRGHHVYAITGDGECEEGAVWEMALFAVKNQLDNFTVVVDHNRIQAMGTCEEVLGFGCLAEKWKSVGFETIECDGHDHAGLECALANRKKNTPVCIIAHTVKGKGVSFMENNLLWHYRDPQEGYYEQAIRELEEKHHEECGC